MPTPKRKQEYFKEKLSGITLPKLAKAAVAAVFVLLLLTMLPAAMPDTPTENTEPPTAFDSEMPEIDAVAKPTAFPHLVIVYPEGEAWGEEEARHVEARLCTRFHAHFVILSDTEYLALDAETLALYNAEPTLTLTLGITSLLEDSYLETLAQVGRDGLDIRVEDGRVDVVSPSYARVNEGVAAFIDSLNFNGQYQIAESLSLEDLRPSSETDFAPDLISDGELNILTFSYVDSNPYTLRALEGIIASAKPDLVVFNGGVDGNAKTRGELALLWEAISETLGRTDTPWCFTPGELTGSLPRITVCEVISSFDGCIRPLDGKQSGGFALTVANSEGIVTAGIYVGDTFDDSAELCARIELDSKLYSRASSYKRTVVAILPAVAEQLYASVGDIPEGYLAEPLSDLFDSLELAGADTVICACSPESPAIIKHEGGQLALCGSIGFDATGIGGRFDYHNSIRGGVQLTLGVRRADYTSAKLTYVYAAELGLTER